MSIGITLGTECLANGCYERVSSLYVADRDIGGVLLRNLTGAHLNALYTELESEGLSIATRRLVHAVLRRSLNDAVRWGKLARNPASGRRPALAPTIPRSIVERPRAANFP